MRFEYVQALLVAPLTVEAARIVMSNDDGWAAKNIRVFYDTLTAAGQDAVISAPAENKSGSSSLDWPPTEVGSDGCEYNSCPANSPPTGSDPSNPRLNYVNSYPVTAMKYGLDNLQDVLGGPADLAVTGINAGSNGGVVTMISGTVGAACAAAQAGVPAIAFSGKGDQVGYQTPTLPYQQIYSDLSVKVVETLLASGAPYLPKDTWLNVNYPDVTDTKCTNAADFRFVLSRIYPWFGGDVATCGKTQLPDESSVYKSDDGCYVSISVANAYTKLDVDSTTQKFVLDKLAPILSCLP